MTKICFVFGGNIQMCPYLHTYLQQMDNEVEFDIIFWERYEFDRKFTFHREVKNQYVFKKKIKSKIDKLRLFLSFKSYVLSILRKNDYNKIIFLQTNMALMCSSYILKNKSKKYILDVRDYSNESNIGISYLENRIFKYFKYIFISSIGFRKFLPQGIDYIPVHNLQNNKMMVTKEDVLLRNNVSKKSIKIGYIGNMKLYVEYLCCVLEVFKNDDRFIFHFIGIGSEAIQEYCVQNNINNIVIRGAFDSREINVLYQEIDVVNNLYGNNNPYLDYALSNKLYLAAQFCLPILTCSDTSMSEVSINNNFGFVVDKNDDNIKDKLYNWYGSIDWSVFYESCHKFIEEVVEENIQFNSMINNFYKE